MHPCIFPQSLEGYFLLSQFAGFGNCAFLDDCRVGFQFLISSVLEKLPLLFYIQSRRKGGDREKKKKRRRKAARKNKDSFKIIRLVSAAGTGYVYAKRKGKKSEKLEIKKYDPVVKHHVFFKESK
ncbi:hypothetical protein BDE02_01G349800 [Populus trichocarpa]|nr:hypothetical protein BDE02_01G349800 [Populus trichocarpa]